MSQGVDVPLVPYARLTLDLRIDMDDPNKVIKVLASDGKTGEQKEIAYTNCKVIGNGSFGVVFQAKLVQGPGAGNNDSEDVAIKKVLQDKRFKVSIYRIQPSERQANILVPTEP